MLSFGHALYFAAGVYGTDILVTQAGWPLWLAVVAGRRRRRHARRGCSARSRCAPTGIAFAMVTLAFAQVGAITVAPRPGRAHRRRGGAADGPAHAAGRAGRRRQHGQPVLARRRRRRRRRPGRAPRSRDAPAGRVLAAVRDDERRVGVLGLDPYRYKLFAFTVAGGLAGLAGAVYALLVGGATPHVAASDLTLSLLVMVVLGGPGTRWGPLHRRGRCSPTSTTGWCPSAAPTRWTACRAC